MRSFVLCLSLFVASTSFAAHMDISSMMTEYQGAASCVSCHGAGSNIDVEAHARAVTQTVHWKFSVDLTEGNVYEYDGDNDLTNDVPVTGTYGKINRYCGLPGSISTINWLGILQPDSVNDAYPNGIPGGCSRCHINNGTLKPANLADDDAWEAVDCLLCHADTYQLNGSELHNYGARLPVRDTTTATGFHLPYLKDADLSVTSQSITANPSTGSCQNCHVWSGGGYTNKRGYDYDGTYGSNTINDVHADSLSCVDCHITKDHKISMGHVRPAAWVNELDGDEDNTKITCAFCHTAEGQTFFSDMTIPVPDHGMWNDSEVRSKHMDNISCQTCHTTENAGLDLKWFDKIKRIIDGSGNFVQWKPVGHKLSGSATLSYKWFNGTVYDNVSPRGESGNGQIHPFRIMESYVPVDDATGIMLPVKLGVLFSADSTISNMGVAEGDSAALIEKMIRTGVKLAASANPAVYGSLVDNDGNYTSSYSYHWDTMNFSVDHGTNVASEALGCTDCHAEGGGRLDWVALGYAGDPASTTSIGQSTQVQRFELSQNAPNPFNPTTEIRYTLGARTNVTMRVYNTVGQLVETVLDGTPQAPGVYTLHFDASGYASGVYFYELEAGDYREMRRLVVLK